MKNARQIKNWSVLVHGPYRPPEARLAAVKGRIAENHPLLNDPAQREKHEDGQHVRTSAIAEILTSRTFRTESGSVYTLVGPPGEDVFTIAGMGEHELSEQDRAAYVRNPLTWLERHKYLITLQAHNSLMAGE